MIAPIGAKSFREALRMGAETYHNLKAVLKSKGLNTSVGDEGGFAPNLNSNEEALACIMTAIEKAKYKPGKDVVIALDAAASSFYEKGKYVMAAEKKPNKTAAEMVSFYQGLVKKYPILSIPHSTGSGDCNHRAWDPTSSRGPGERPTIVRHRAGRRQGCHIVQQERGISERGSCIDPWAH